jgi:LuxR family transcriptional regulator, maltose regulon positive regulatory protein
MSARGTARRSDPPARRARHALQVAQRTALVNRLRAVRECSVVTVVAPAGYGKTTLLAQWAERDQRPFVSIATDPTRRSASAVLEAVARGLREVGSADHSLVPTPAPLAAAWARVGKPAVLVFDDAHRLGDKAAAAVSRLIAATPPGSLVVLAGRALPRLTDPSLPLLRATGRLLELGAGDLAMSRREALAAFKAFGVSVGDSELTALLERTEGWAAGIHQVAAMRLNDGPGRRNGRREAYGATQEFFRDECLAALGPEQRSFLRRTSVLDRMCGPLCDATLDASGSAAVLESLAASGVFLVPLDRRGEWWRYHHLLRDSLRQELAEHHPELVAGLHQRAAAWLEYHGDSREALRHAYAGGNREHFLRVFGTAALAEYNRGSSADVENWLGDLADGELLDADPRAAVVAARLHAQFGQLHEAERCLAAASRGCADDTATEAAAALVRAAICAGGADAMLTDTRRALEALPSNDIWGPFALLLQGTAHALLGQRELSAATLGHAVTTAERLEAHDTLVLALAECSLLAAAGGSWAEADDYLLRACGTAEEHGLEAHPGFALALALSARSHLRNGLWNDAQAAIAGAQRLLPRLTSALPWLAVQARLELASAFVMLRDAHAAVVLLAQVDEILAARPRLGRLRRRRDRVAADVAAIPAGDDGQTVRLSRAELRLLPLLGTHLSFREIGAHLFLSRHTVKTQAISAYRKLGASSRREAVIEAARLALIEAPPDLGALSS